MFTLNGKYSEANVYAETIDDVTIGQILTMLNEPVTEGGKVAIMPDSHFGKGSTVGTTIHYPNGIKRVTPSIIGVDVGCAIMITYLGDIEDNYAVWSKLDQVIHDYVPHGFSVHDSASTLTRSQVAGYVDRLSFQVKDWERIAQSVGTLGGGNHLIEVGVDSNHDYYLIVHTGSRGLGIQVEKTHQRIAEQYHAKDLGGMNDLINSLKAQGRQREIEGALKKFSSDKPKLLLPYLEGEQLGKYLNDMVVAQEYANFNRQAISDTICHHMGWAIQDRVDSVHNYIDTQTNTIRKGATDASLGKRLVIPLNMQFGSIIGVGKGNEDWNNSAPHGAGRVLSRTKAKENLDMKEYQEQMKQVYTTSVVESTLDEAPRAYKDPEEIIRLIEPTVDIQQIVKPVYNFKSH